MHFFRCNEREPFLKIKTELVSETALGTGSCPVSFESAFVKNMLEQSQVLLHDRNLGRMPGAVKLHAVRCEEFVEGL